ncbi:hypothetical protein LJC56_11285 [Christensenellaceae bacterium OttesenSCG-928-K19]|nr:hypothetical protein [Christensenellaceae bacterium OttesenSCG-928-K19]
MATKTRKSNPIKVDLVNSTITVYKTFYAKACIFGSDEYRLLKKVLNENPGTDWKIEIKQQKKNANRKSYKNLSMERMENYIILKDGENSPNHREFKQVKKASSIHSSPFTAVRKWFTETYEDYNDFKAVLGIAETPELDENGKPNLEIMENKESVQKKGSATK